MTGDADDALDVERLRQTASTWHTRRVVELQPGACLDHDAPMWQDAIIFVTAGVFDIECTSGERHSFRRGDILSLARLPILRAGNSGETPTRLLAICRRS